MSGMVDFGLIGCIGFWQEELIAKLGAGARSGRATSAEKQLEKMRDDGLIEKPYVAKRRSFTFPNAERLGRRVLEIDALTHGYQDRTLFKNAQLEMEKGDRVAIIGALPQPLLAAHKRLK